MPDSTQRFSSRVADYVRYRPSYPAAVVDALIDAGVLHLNSSVADVGSGTGLLAELFVQRGITVCGIEPNAAMREAGDAYLAQHPAFSALAGTAEATGLADDSIDLVVAGQAFHWFDRERFRAECGRILRPNGAVALVWNNRNDDDTPFARAYEHLLRTYGTDYSQVRHNNISDAEIMAWFGPQGCEMRTFPYQQQVDFAGLRGRLLSSSYTPDGDDPRRAPMLAELQRIFDQYNDAGTVTIAYTTTLYYGRLKAEESRK